MSHPDLLGIDALRLGGGRPEDADHVRQCADCRQILADLEEVAAELKQLALHELTVPAEVEQRILWQARKRALGIRRSPRVRWRQAAAVAAAALVVLGLASLLARREGANHGESQMAMRPAAAPAVQLAAADVDGDGRIDILDAFALARAVESRASGPDVDGNGAIDARDVDALSRRAVALGGA